MAAPKVKAPPPELIAAPKGAPKAKAAPTPEQCAEWRDNPSLEKLGLMTDAALILAAKAEDKARLDAHLRELRSNATEEELQRLPMMFEQLPTRSALRARARRARREEPELTARLSASSVPPSEPPSEPAGDSSTPDHDHVSEAGMIDLKMLLDHSSTPTAPYQPLPLPSQLMPPPPADCQYCNRGLLNGNAEQYWEDHLRQQADRGAGPPTDDLPDPSAKTMNAETTSTDQSTDQSTPAAIHIEFF